MSKKTMTVKEMREYLGIGANAAYNLVHTEGFPALRVGKTILIPVDMLEEWMRNNAAAGASVNV